jgi:diguanylate cyclase (GGDEF)-like protein/PAS domain S-box-containing protein
MEAGAASRTHGTRAALTGYTLGAAALVGCYLLAPARRPLWWALLGFLSVAAVGYGVYRHRPRPAAPWILLAAALLAESAGDLAYHAAGGSIGGRSPFPTVADGFYLAVYPLAIAALAAFVRRDPPAYGRGTLLDVLIVVTGLSALAWSVFVIPYSRLADESALGKTILIAYLLGDAVLLAMTLHLPLAGRLRSAPVRLLVLGTLGVLFSDAYYGLAQLHSAWSPGRAANLGWAVFFISWGLAALLPSMAQVAEPPAGRPWALVAPRTWVVLLWCAALLSPVLLLLDTTHATRRESQVLAACCVVLFALVFARLALAMRDWRETILRRETEAYLRTLIADALDAIIIATCEGTVRFASRSARTLFGDRLESATVSDLLAGPDRDTVAECFERLADPDAQPDWPRTVHFDTQDDRAVLAEARWSDLRADPTVAGIALTLRDVTEERRLQDELRRQALTDPLTGLANRQGLLELLRRAYAAADVGGAGAGVAATTDAGGARDEDAGGSRDARGPGGVGGSGGLLMVDLDDFKEVNDTLGHPIGDEVLVAVADRLAARVREADAVARLGGDEFAVLLAHGPDPAELERIAQRLVDAFDEPLETSAGPLRVAASLGLAVFGTHGLGDQSADPDALLRNADLALYEAKAEGKHRWHRYHSGLLDQAVHRAELRAALDEALLSGGLAVWYQPVVYLETRRISGFEALVRWPHPHLGLLSPDRFIPLAEDTGQIVELGKQVLRIAVAQAAIWNAAGGGTTDSGGDGGGCYVGVNVSVHQLRAGDYVEAVREVLASTGMDPAYVVLEVTETALLDNDDADVRERLHALQRLGVNIALDDFGTGYASLISLHDMPIDVIKVDKGFTSRLTVSARMRRLVRGLLTIGDAMHIRTVAEGVERWEQHEALIELGCRAAQGFLYSKPLPADQATALWAAGRALPEPEQPQAQAQARTEPGRGTGESKLPK